MDPLLNHLILEKIFAHLNVEDLKTVRSICRLWNLVAERFLATNGIIQLEGLLLERYIKFLHSANQENYLFVKFSNVRLKIDSYLSKSPHMSYLWVEIGARIEHLHLELTTEYATHALGDIVFSFCPMLKTIKIIVTKYWPMEDDEKISEKTSIRTLETDNNCKPNLRLTCFSYTYLGSMSLYGYNDTVDDFMFPLCWKQFFASFPNLQVLCFVGMSSIELTSMLNELIMSEKSCTALKTLQILDENVYPEAPNDHHLMQLISLSNRLKLTELDLEVSPHLQTPILNTFLNSLESLEILRLRRFPVVDSFSMDFTLKLPLITIKVLEISNTLVKTFDFLNHLPNVNALDIVLRDYRNISFCEMVENTSLESFPEPHGKMEKIFVEAPLCSSTCVSKLLNVLTCNLTHVKLRLNNEMLWVLCGSSVQSTLKDLHIIAWDGLTDEGITGISETVLWAMPSSNFSSYRTRPYVGLLKIGTIFDTELEKITIETWMDSQNRITDASVYYGMLDLPSLVDFKFLRASISSIGRRILMQKCYYNKSI